jgi:hypothetical protein
LAEVRLRHVFGEAFSIIRRYPAAALLPAAALGVMADVLQVVDGGLLAQLAVGLAIGVAFELYVAYAERLVLEAHRGAPRVSLMRLLRAAFPLLPWLVLASIPAFALPAAASGLLVLPGIWLLTRWVLYAPVIAREAAGPVAALRRSSQLVRGHFWPVLGVATASLIIEHAVIHAAAHTAEPALGSKLLGLLGAGVTVALVSPFAALTISLVYDRLSAAGMGRIP